MTIDTILRPAETKRNIEAAMLASMAVAEAIRTLREIPSGTLYAQVCGKLSLQTYQMIIQTLKSAGLVEETTAHMLRWTGPVIA